MTFEIGPIRNQNLIFLTTRQCLEIILVLGSTFLAIMIGPWEEKFLWCCVSGAAFLQLLVLELALELLVLCHFAHGLHEVLTDHIVPLCSDREHARFGHHIPEISSVEAV